MGAASSVKRRLSAEYQRVLDCAGSVSGSEGDGQFESERAQQGRSSSTGCLEQGGAYCAGGSPGVTRQRPAEANGFTWVCDDCKVPLSLSAKTQASLGSKRNKHITHEHPKIPRTRFHQVRAGPGSSPMLRWTPTGLR